MGRLGSLGRGIALSCPRCGSRGLFASYFRLRERCPRCGLGFEREEGYWVGAMVVSIAVTEAAFGAVFVGGMVLTWPDVPWNLLWVTAVALNLILPVILYPWSKTVWLGLDHAFNPVSADEPAE